MKNHLKSVFINLNRKKLIVDCVINCSYPRPVKFDKNPLNLSKKNFLDYFETHLWAFNAANREFSEYFKK